MGYQTEKKEQLPSYCQKKILIAGCGNRLFGDDGFGPEVIDYLKNHYHIPEDVCLIDTGTGLRKILLTISLSNIKPEVIVIVDSIDRGGIAGEIHDISLDKVPEEKVHEYSVHQGPSSHLLKELRDLCSIRVRIMSCQIKKIPEAVQPGLSEPVRNAVSLMSRKIAEEYF